MAMSGNRPRSPAPAPRSAASPEAARARALATEADNLLRQAELSGSAGDFEAALKTFEQALALLPDDKAALEGIRRAELRLAEMDMEAGAFCRAEERLRHRGPEHRQFNGKIDEARRDFSNRRLYRQLFIGAIFAALGLAAVIVSTPAPPDTRGKGEKKEIMAQLGGPKQESAPKEQSQEQTLINEALKHDEAGRHADAIRLMDQAIAKYPNSWGAYNTRSNARSAKGDFDGALKDIEQVIRLNPKWGGGWNNRGNLRMRKGDYAGAAADFDKAIEYDKKSGMVYCNRAHAAQYIGDMDAAIRFFGKGIEAEPNYVASYIERGLARRGQGDLDGAKADFEAANRKKNNLPNAFYGLGLLRADAGDWKGAVENYDKAIKAEPKFAEAWVARALAEEKLKKTDEVKRSMEEAAKLSPETGLTRENLLRQFETVRLCRIGRALEDKALEKADEYLARAQYRMTRKKFDEATADFEAALKLDEATGPVVFSRLAQIAEFKGDGKAKIAAYRRWADAATNDPNAQNACAWELLTAKDESLRDPVAALPYAQRASKLTKDESAAILDTLALALFRAGKIDDAILTEQRALGFLPHDANGAERKEFEDRLKEFEAAKTKPASPVDAGK